MARFLLSNRIRLMNIIDSLIGWNINGRDLGFEGMINWSLNKQYSFMTIGFFCVIDSEEWE